jgi:hypothetical protein
MRKPRPPEWSAEKSDARAAKTDVRTVVLDGRSDGTSGVA